MFASNESTVEGNVKNTDPIENLDKGSGDIDSGLNYTAGIVSCSKYLLVACPVADFSHRSWICL